MPAEQYWPEEQVLPQPPQWLLSLLVSTQELLHCMVVAWQATAQQQYWFHCEPNGSAIDRCVVAPAQL